MSSRRRRKLSIERRRFDPIPSWHDIKLKIIKYRSDDVRFAPPRVSRHLILSLATSRAASCAIYPTPKYVAGYDIAMFHNDDSKVSFSFCPRRRKLTLRETLPLVHRDAKSPGQWCNLMVDITSIQFKISSQPFVMQRGRRFVIDLSMDAAWNAEITYNLTCQRATTSGVE